MKFLKAHCCNLPQVVLIKGAGDLASGVAHRLHRCGFKIIMTEIEKPTVVRRTVSFAQAIFDKTMEVEGVLSERVNKVDECNRVWEEDKIPLLVDPPLECLPKISPGALIEATVTKKNTGVNKHKAPLVMALGPGYRAGEDARADVHAVVETARGHDLGKAIYSGEALPNTGIPGEIEGFTDERLLKATSSGIFHAMCSIGDKVKAGDVVAYIGSKPVKANLNGMIRGLLYRGLYVKEGMKVGDIDPRAERKHCFTVSDKARAIAGGVLEVLLSWSRGLHRHV